MGRKVWVAKETDGFDRTLPSGEVIRVKKHRRTLPDNPKHEVLSDEWAEKWIKEDLYHTHPDYVNTSKIVFLKPNVLWAQNRKRYDVLGLDCVEVPVHTFIPSEGIPNQIIKVKGKYYLADQNGAFKRHFPPEIEKLKKEAIEQYKAKSQDEFKKKYGKTIEQALKDNTPEDKKNLEEFEQCKKKQLGIQKEPKKN